MQTNKIKSSKVLFIKLGRGGQWEKECIENGYLRFGFNETSHEDCVNDRWSKVHDFWLQKTGKKQRASSVTNQVKDFYSHDESVLWITFYCHKLWWAFAKKGVILNTDGSKIRKTVDGWKDCDLLGKYLTDDNLSGKLLKVQMYQGTICEVSEAEYLLRRINVEDLKELQQAKEALEELEKRVGILIRYLHWKDFEVLVDLILRQEGWQRFSVVGKNEKTLDLDLLLPVTGERAMVQIKSESTKNEFEGYLNTFEQMQTYDKFFYFVHTPSKDLIRNVDLKRNIRLIVGDEVGKMAIKAGLINWILGKVS